MIEEKRVAPRFLFSEPVAYGQPDVIFNGSVAGNISLSGISLKVQEFIAVGVVLELQLCLGHSSKVVWTKAEVVRIRQVLSEDCYEIGLKFLKDAECIKAVGEYVSTWRPQTH